MFRFLMKLTPCLFFLMGLATHAIAQTAGMIEYGKSVSGEINDETSSVLYNFNGSAGDVIYAAVFTENFYDFTPQVRLVGPDGSTLGGATQNALGALFGPFTLPTDGTYGVEASRPFDSDTSGTFTMRVDKTEVLLLESGVSQTGTLSGTGAVAFFDYRGTAGDLLSYHLRADANFGLMMMTPGGQTLVWDAYNTELFTPLNQLPETGDYRVVIQTGTADETEYQLDFARIEPLVLQPGQNVSGTVSEFPPAVFAFDTLADKMWQISASLSEPERGSANLFIFSGANVYDNVASDYGSGPNGQPRIEPFIAPADGIYYAVFNYYDGAAEGDNQSQSYEALLIPSTLVSLSPGAQVKGTVTLDSGGTRYAYNGTAGETIRLTLTKTGGEGWPRFSVTSPETQILDMSGYVLTSATFEIALPVDGMYLIEIRNDYYEESAVEYTLLLERGG